MFLSASSNIALLGLIVGVSVGVPIALVAVASLSICAIKKNRRSVALSPSNKCRGKSNPMEELDINITHNSAYGQVKESQLGQDGSVVYETIKDNCLYEIQANEAYGPLQCSTPCYENPDEIFTRN